MIVNNNFNQASINEINECIKSKKRGIIKLSAD